jgi:quercetin dioxygenase-like cupin family protein
VAKDRNNSTDGVVREHLLTGAFGPLVDRIEVYRVTLQPGQKAGRHFHPGGVVGYVVDGEIALELEEEPPVTILRQGSVFYEPPDATITRFDNVSATATATFIACYPLTGDQTLITYAQL